MVPLRDPAAALDAYEGPQYRRLRVVVPADGTVCWADAWQGSRDGLTPLASGWPPAPAGDATRTGGP